MQWHDVPEPQWVIKGLFIQHLSEPSLQSASPKHTERDKDPVDWAGMSPEKAAHAGQDL